jgi:branched-chain amino acid transport system substrate-binding protein
MSNLTRRTFLKGAAALGAAAAVGGFPAILKQAQGARPVKWGSIQPTTGPYATEALDQKLGVELAIADTNARGGVMGREVELHFRDDQFKWDQVTSHALDLLDNVRIDFLGGSMLAPEQIRLNAISRKRKIIYANYPQDIMSTPESAKKMSPYFFTCNVTPYQNAASVARLAHQLKMGKKWHFLGDDYTWPKMFLPAFIALAKETGSIFDPDRDTSWVPFPASVDYSANFPKILKLGPDVLFVSVWGSRQVAFIKQALEARLHEKLQIVINVTEVSIAEAAGPGLFTDIYAGATWYWKVKDKYPGAKDFYDKFWAVRKRPPSAYASSAYEVVRLVLDTADEIKSLDTVKVAKALEGRKFQYVKGPSWIRPCDHVDISEFFVLKGNKLEAMQKDKWDVFNIVDVTSGEGNALSCAAKGLT